MSQMHLLVCLPQYLPQIAHETAMGGSSFIVMCMDCYYIVSGHVNWNQYP